MKLPLHESLFVKATAPFFCILRIEMQGEREYGVSIKNRKAYDTAIQ